MGNNLKLFRYGVLAVVGAANGCLAAGDAGAAGDDWRLATVTPQESLAIDALLTTINGEPIYAKDVIRPLDAELRTMAGQIKEQHKTLRDFRDLAIARLDIQLRETVRNILMFSAAKDALNEDELHRIDQIMNAEEKKVLAKFRGSRALADAQLRGQGTSMDRELQFRRRQMTVAFYQHKMLAPQINVRRQDVVDEYESNIAKYTIVPEADLHLIRIDASRFLKDVAAPTPEQVKDAESKAWALAREIYGRLKAGAEFATEAGKYSDDAKGVDGGHYPHDKLTSWKWPELAKKALAAESNSLIEPFAAPDPAGGGKPGAMFVLKVGQVVTRRVKSFDEVQEEIAGRLQAQQEQALDKVLTHKLYEKAAIDNKDDLQQVLETITKVVVTRYAVEDDK